MNTKLRRILCGCTALALIASVGCSDKEDNGKTSESQAASTESKAETDESAAEGGYQRQDIPLDPVTETLSGFDLTPVTGEDSAVPEDFEFSAEGEEGQLSGNASTMDKSFLGEFSGSGFAVVPTENDLVEFEVELPAEGSYDLDIIAATDIEGANMAVTVDGEALTTFQINSTEFSENKAEKVLIGEGKHKIGIYPQTSSLYLDTFSVRASQKIDPADFEVNRTLSNPNASDETKRLYNFMCDAYGKYIISGQYSPDNKGVEAREFSEIQKNYGDYPAIMGLDLIEASPSRVANGSTGAGENLVEKAKDWYLNQNGIITLCWHWNAPEPYIGKNGAQWWRGFYTDSTDISLSKILNGEDQEGYDLLLRDIDAIADYLKELDDYHVPVLWRPLHEGGGDPKWNNPWFWWGSSGAEAYKELWKLMYDRLTNYHEINNLIWVWNGQNVDYYPGDEYVDIIGFDVYADAGDYTSKKWYYDYTKSATTDKKIVAMTENGTLFDPDAAMNDGTRWSYFATWNGEFTIKDFQLSPEYTSLEMWEKIYKHDRVLTLTELPDLKNYPLDTQKYLEEHPDEAPKE